MNFYYIITKMHVLTMNTEEDTYTKWHGKRHRKHQVVSPVERQGRGIL